MKKILLTLFFAILTLQAAEFCFDADSQNVEFINSAKQNEKCFDLSGRRSSVILQGTEKFDLSRGGTLMAECRVTDFDRDSKRFRFLFQKNRDFLFGFTGGKYNFSLCDNGRWSIAIIGGELPPNNQWIHLAAVARRIEDKEQGKVGFLLEIYLNGEKILNKFVSCAKLRPGLTAPVQLSAPEKANHFTGEVAQVRLFERALTSAEILKEAKACRFAKITVPGQFEVPLEIMKRTATLKGTCADFAGQSLYRAALTGVPQVKVLRGIDAAEKCAKNGKNFIAEFNAAQQDFRMFPTRQGILFAAIGDCGKAFPVIDIWDTAAGRGVFGPRANGFKVRYKDRENRSIYATDFADGAVVSSRFDKPDATGNVPFEFRWRLSGKFEAISQGSWGASGLRMNLEVVPHTGIALESVTFPQWNFARKRGRDFLVTPFMSGLLVANPIDNYNYEREYPCAQIAMLFQAYYSEKGDGVYAALEDPVALAHGISVGGKGNLLCTTWHTLVPQGEHFKLSGEAVVRLFQGDWYTAAMLYREFLVAKANWWIPELPRTSTPQWLRDNSIWILAGVYPSRNTKTMLYLREYFEQEFGVHYVGTCERAWPHFDRTTEHALKTVKKLQATGIKVIPYSDPRLWREAVNSNGAIGTKPNWEPGSAEMAIQGANGKPVVEKYGKYSCLVLCPAHLEWQKTYIDICSRLTVQGFDGIYHDQLPCGHFEPCYNKNHHHKITDPANWVANGYGSLYRKLREVTAKENPKLFHTGEDASEPFLNLIDGFTTWRWVEPNQIPLFQTIYSGRIQFTGKLYNHQYPGDWESGFAKAASQLVNAEQLGWVTLEDLEMATPFRKFFKTLAWYRRALLEYFNAGMRLAPLKFTRDPGTLRSHWGNTSGIGQSVSLPKIQHAVYRLADGRVMALFVNTTPEKQRAAVQWPYGVKNLRVCRPQSAVSIPMTMPPELTLAPYSGEVWLVSEKENRREADRIAALWHKTAAFDEGKNLHWRKVARQKAPAELTLKTGVLNSVTLAAEVRESTQRYYANGTDKDKVLHFADQSMLRYEKLHPESGAVRRIAIVAAWLPAEAGSRFEVRSAGRTIGQAVLGKGGHYLEFHEIPVELQEALADNSDIEIVFHGKSCLIKGFKTLSNQQE